MIRNIVFVFTASFSCVISLDFRLPKVVKPSHYDLEILTNINDTNNNFGYQGTVEIKVIAVEATKSIILHSKGLQIGEEQLKVINEDKHISENVKNIEYDTTHDFLIINLQENLHKNSKYKLKISFFGLVSEGISGFYRSSYLNQQTQTEWLLITQFKPNHARSAFPCFDEPEFKATFSIQIGRHYSYTSASNMPIEQIKSVHGINLWFWDMYEKTPQMPTYLIAFMVSKLSHKTVSKNNITFGVWVKSSSIDDVDYALQVAPNMLEYYENYFSIPYPLPKLDMVAVPEFNSSAMENWGFMTLHEASILFKTYESSEDATHMITKMIAYKIANQWVGNLVTIKWWSELWINEGFATFLGNIAIHMINQDYDAFNQHYIDELAKSFKLDTLRTSHPVNLKAIIENQNDIETFSDSTTYEKGSIILHMLHEILGETVFRTGLKRYLITHEYGSAEQDDLWEAFSIAAHSEQVLPCKYYVKEIMDTWTIQSGYPVISIDRDYLTTTVIVSQLKFQLLAEPYDNVDKKWWIPLSYSTEDDIKLGNLNEIQWFKKIPSMNLTIPLTSDQWILFNVNVSAFYRVNYDIKNWELLSKALLKPNYGEIPLLNRYQLVVDSLDLAWAGQLSYNVTLRLLYYIGFENVYYPWIGMLSAFNIIDSILIKLPSYDIFILYVKYMVLMHKFSNLNKTLELIEQPLIFDWFCKVDPKDCDEKALALFSDFMENSKNKTYNIDIIPKKIRKNVFCTALEKGGENEWRFLWHYLFHVKLPSEKLILINALGCTKIVSLLNRYLEWSYIPSNGMKVQETYLVFESIASNSVGYNIALKFLEDNIEPIIEYHRDTPQILALYVKFVLERLTTDDEFARIQQIIESNKNNFEKFINEINQSIDIAKDRLIWIRAQYGNFIYFLNDTIYGK